MSRAGQTVRGAMCSNQMHARESHLIVARHDRVECTTPAHTFGTQVVMWFSWHVLEHSVVLSTTGRPGFHGTYSSTKYR